MDINKDYYKILGVLDDAEDIVIKAAYRALAQKYHPDRFQGNAKTAKERMQEINEAYEVLSDPKERKKYDGSRKKQDFEQDNSQDTKDLLKTLEKDWKDAIEFLPDLEDLSLELAQYSKQLEYTFKVLVIEQKKFNDRFDLAEKLKKQFLVKYFGSDINIQNFAESLFEKKDIKSLKKLNRAVTLLGSEIDSEVIINKIIFEESIKDEYKRKETDNLKVTSAKILTSHSVYISYFEEISAAINFMNECGAKLERRGFLTEVFILNYKGKERKLSPEELIQFARKEALLYLKKK